MAETLTFFGWWRPEGASAVSSAVLTAGRLSAAVQLTAFDVDRPSDSATRTVNYDLLGPGDATGLGRGAVVHNYPASGAHNVEIDKAVYAELGAPDLPWRYTVALPQGKALRPWLMLVVGTADEIEVNGSLARVQASALDAHPLFDSARAAHVEQALSGRIVARLLSPRPLTPDRDHVAVIVPAFTTTGAPAWTTPAPGPLDLPAYHHWRFHTKAGGDFAALARRLRLRTGAGLGTATIEYGPIAATTLDIRGALAPVTEPSKERPAAEVVADLRAMTRPQGDSTHPVLGLPDYSEPWPANPAMSPPAGSTGWRDQLRVDYRVRAVAGLGAAAGIVHQDLLAREASRLAGAYEEAADRLRRLSFGLLTARSLWRRRVPVESARRLGVVGTALRSVLTTSGPVSEVVEHGDRGLERGLFSSAAIRSLRRPVAADLAAPEAAGRPAASGIGAALRAAASAAPRPSRSDAESLHTDAFAAATQRTPLDDALTKTPPKLALLGPKSTKIVRALHTPGLDLDTKNFLTNKLDPVLTNLKQGRPVQILPLLRLRGGASLPRERLRELVAALDVEPDSEDLAAMARQVGARPRPRINVPLDLDRVTDEIKDAFDPTIARPVMVDRVVASIADSAAVLTDSAAPPVEPVELSPELDLPAWRFLRDRAPEWLLPGAGTVPADSVVALTTNPAFVDAFLLGLNAQVVGELRFRNLPLIPAWAPVRTFWDRANPGTGAVDDDIVEINTWLADSPFGAASHQTPSAANADLVLLFHTSLFREYPGTLVYLAPARRTAGGSPDWIAGPDLDFRQFPSFQGRFSAEQPFFGFDLDPMLGAERWVVLEETINGRRFFNAGRTSAAANAARNGADLSRATLSPARRVLIRGDILLGRTSR